ncbi:hypothetical protein ABZY57_06545 [Streptomyces sp. NPDC006450]|uniref:hypothetical protein n=1 Tax=Streptomyces sp. NPDC006450 TaxID=3155458 RepID=UPI0033A5BFF7
MRCEISAPGDYTITYELAAEAAAPAWKLRSTATYEVYEWGTGNPQKASDFMVGSTIPVTQRFRLVGRDAEGKLWDYRGTGIAAQPFGSRVKVGVLGTGFAEYNLLF